MKRTNPPTRQALRSAVEDVRFDIGDATQKRSTRQGGRTKLNYKLYTPKSSAEASALERATNNISSGWDLITTFPTFPSSFQRRRIANFVRERTNERDRQRERGRGREGREKKPYRVHLLDACIPYGKYRIGARTNVVCVGFVTRSFRSRNDVDV